MVFSYDTITIDTDTAAQPTPTPTVKPSTTDLSPLPEVAIEVIDGVQYVRKSNIEEMLQDIGLGNYEFAGSYFYDKTRHDGISVLENIPYSENDITLIPYDYYVSTIIPVINSLR